MAAGSGRIAVRKGLQAFTVGAAACLVVVSGKPAPVEAGRLVGVYEGAISPDGRLVVTGGGEEVVRLWDATTGKHLRSFPANQAQVGPIHSVAISPDGRQILTDDGETVRLWNAATGKEVRQFGTPNPVIQGSSGHPALFSPDGKQVLSGSGDEENLVELWETATGKRLRRFAGYSDDPVAFFPDGKRVFVADARGARVCDVNTGKALRAFQGSSTDVEEVAVSPDGRTVLTANGDNAVRLWDVATGKELRRLVRPGYVDTLGFAAGGRQLLTGSTDEWRVWDAGTGAARHRFRHTGQPRAFSPEGRFVLTSGENGTARLWNTMTGKLLRRFQRPASGT